MDDKPLVLIVDDDPVVMQVLFACLKDMCRIEMVSSGEECLRFIDKGMIPDLILLDIQMPGIDGYEVCEFLKNHILHQQCQ